MRVWTVFCFFWLFCLLYGCETSPSSLSSNNDFPSAPPEAVYDYQSPRTNIPVVLIETGNGERLPFIVDTGANTSALYPWAASRLGVEPTENAEVTIRSLSGIASMPIGVISELTVAGDQYRNVKVALLPSRTAEPDAAGILGTDILQNYALFFNPDQNILQFFEAKKFPSALYSTWVRFTIRNIDQVEALEGLWFATTSLGEQEIPVLIDTGADFSIMNWIAAKQRLYLRELYNTMQQDWALSGAVGTFTPTANVILHRLELGDFEWDAPRFIVLELKALGDLLGPNVPLMIAGANLFSDKEFVIDFSGQTIWIKPDTENTEDGGNDPQAISSTVIE